MDTLATSLAFICLLLNLTLFIHLRPPYSFMMVIFQLAAAALSPGVLLLAVVAAVLGVGRSVPLAVGAGLLAALISAAYMWQVLTTRADFTTAFGPHWRDTINPHRSARLPKRRWGIGLPPTQAPRWTRDIPFWTVPGTNRQLLCDIWQPPTAVTPSGLAIVYLHGSAWYLLDKDYGTRPFFRQLAAQGHVVMDVAYRLVPEVDIYGMVADVKRAVAWMKGNAARYGVDPAQVVLAGASAGGHLALLAAYAPTHPALTPPDVLPDDLTVRAVVSYYGPTDLRSCYEHLEQTRLIGLPPIEIGMPGAAEMKKDMVQAGRLDALLGGHLFDVPDVYALASPVTHVTRHSPPTLLIQGQADLITPAEATRVLYRHLLASGIPAVNVIYPWTNHAFDLLLPGLSPAAQSALYELQHFLAIVAGD